MSQCSCIAKSAPSPIYQVHYVASLVDLGVIYVLGVFVNRLLSQGKLVELFPGWQTCGHTLFTVTPKSRFVAPRTRAFIEFLLASLDAQRRPAPGRVWGCLRGDGGGGEG
ncbi:hypothetical protein OF001_U50084 [Pseudomonas sp. OF001]|uniref:hypothetical protein n=1 Tax=Pseudomonas sp. OF001 TaxID=2772300 RepID=UPI00191A30D4|nr:hypothetical protein [Pseudomonas sp. OF001]CAD5379267.1 hypothetical protein OF001_U50084 [Pseudomonas sp. OF001]